MIGRFFLALELDAPSLVVARDAQGLISGDLVRKVPAESWHITVKFLGNVSLDEIARPVFEALAPLVRGTSPVALGEGHMDGFPSLSCASVVVLACGDPDVRLARLAAHAEEAAATLGVDRETRAFRPHVTLARAKDFDARKLAQRFTPRKLGCAKSLTLFESQHARYVALASAAYTTSK